jgi:beta-N-acetylhexosaminidase
MISAFITGLSGAKLTADERDFLADVKPAGLIVFARNVVDADQLRRLIGDATSVIGGGDVLVLVDQEGGRVQRIREPLTHNLPSAAAIAELYDRNPAAARDTAFSIAALAAQELRGFGITMNCAPVLDVPVAGAHDVIGDRAFGHTAEQVSDLARQVARGLIAGGIAPVMKHIPGHGRAGADSHHDLPIVEASHAELSATDFAPFKALADLPAAMTAHVVYTAIDRDQPASTSRRVTDVVIRGEIGFDGLLMSDDLSMKALSGPMRTRAEAVIAAGSDLALHCNGDLAEMRAVAAGVPALAGDALRRFESAARIADEAATFDLAATRDLLQSMMRETTQRG